MKANVIMAMLTLVSLAAAANNESSTFVVTNDNQIECAQIEVGNTSTICILKDGTSVSVENYKVEYICNDGQYQVVLPAYSDNRTADMKLFDYRYGICIYQHTCQNLFGKSKNVFRYYHNGRYIGKCVNPDYAGVMDFAYNYYLTKIKPYEK